MSDKDLIKKAFLIRRFEERLLLLFSQGELSGTVHTCIGQEWVGVAAANAMEEKDSVFSNHRGHGHFLARTGDVRGLASEIMGKSTGVCGGRGGSQHLYAPGFYSNGIQGGMAPVACGKALSEKLNNSNNICVIFIGDGTFGQGVLYEALNIASKWELPLLVVAENNGIAQTTLQGETMSGSIEARARAFNIEYSKSATRQWQALLDDFKSAVSYVRGRTKPFLLEIKTYRLKPHSKGDDTRDPAQILEYEKKDPLNQLISEGSAQTQQMLEEIDTEIESALDEARRSEACRAEDYPFIDTQKTTWQREDLVSGERIVKLINRSLRENLGKNDKIVMLGLDIKEPYGGAFKVSKGLSTEFPRQVINTPISEAAIIGVGTGLALSGYIPVVEIMFGDFLILGFDQLLNHACKLRYMYNDQVKVPLIIRTPMGGKRGYGPTHSQALEKHFLGIPDLDILALNDRVSPLRIYNALFEQINSPTLVIENKVLYTRFLNAELPAGFDVFLNNEAYPTVRISPSGQDPEVTVFCYGEMLQDVERAIEIAFDENDIMCEVICPTLIQPLNIQPVLESVSKTRRLLTVEENSCIAGLSSEVIAKISERQSCIDMVRRVSYNSFLPCSREAERQVLPDVEAIVSRLKEMTNVPV